MEAVLAPIALCRTPGPRLDEWRLFEKYMRDDGWIVDESGTISANVPSAVALIESMTAISDISGIEEGIKRLQTITDDAAAIGAAKELVESTAKVLLIELGHDVGPKPELNKFVQTVHVALGLHPNTGNNADSSNSIKRVLTGAKSVVLGLNEFRNAGYGTGHGQAIARRGLSSRHARLAIHAAVLWCDLVISTFTDPAAPWKNPERF